jgi:hypothetical protein
LLVGYLPMASGQAVVWNRIVQVTVFDELRAGSADEVVHTAL